VSDFVRVNKVATSPPATSASYDLPEVVNLLQRLKTWRADNYTEWIKVGALLHNISPDLLPVWEWWSRQSNSYEPGVCAAKWNSFGRDNGGDKLGIGSLRYWANEDNPSAPAPKPLSPLSFSDFREQHKSYKRPVIIDGLLRGQDTMMIVGGTKTRKTYFVIQLVLSIAAALLFLGKFVTSSRNKILVLDYELFEDDIVKRVEQTQRALGVNDDALNRIEYVSMRGKESTRIDEVCNWLDTLPPGTYDLVVFDAIYRAYPEGFNENDNENYTRLMNRADATARRHGNAFIFVHHTSKGSQARKSNTDIGSGAGAQSRAVDCHLTLVEHSEGRVRMQASLRSFAPMEPVVLQFDWPTWSIDQNADPNLATGLAHVGVEDVVSLLASEQGKEEFIKGASRMLKAKGFYAPITDIRRVVQLAIDEQRINQSTGKRGKLLIAPVEDNEE